MAGSSVSSGATASARSPSRRDSRSCRPPRSLRDPLGRRAARAAGAVALNILLVCTANQCRSPMAEAILRARLAERGFEAKVLSSGASRLPGGVPATEHAVAELAGRGLDLSSHRSRQLSPKLIAGADLIVGMTRDHVRAVVDIDPDALDRTFTLKDFVRRAGPLEPGQPVSKWVQLLAESRSSSDVLGIGDDGIEDPIGQGAEAYARCADELESVLSELAAKLAP